MKIDSSVAMQGYEASKANRLNNLNNALSKDDKALKEQTDAFESILLKFMLDTSLNMQDPLYPKQPGSEIYQSMYKDTLAEQLSGSFGYSKALYEWIKEQQKG